MNPFSSSILQWHQSIDRDMPWKETQDPYKIWISEVILQQTRVAQGRDYYIRFIEKFPTIQDLAQADQSAVLKQWEGLGYYSRARNLHYAAQQVVNDHGGIFPDDYKDILSLKGIGPYTAAAIASFAFHKLHAVVDGNVIRVLSRYFGITRAFDTTDGKKEFQKLAQELIQKTPPAEYNQAIMDFGALICTPKLTKCLECPVTNECNAYENDMVDSLPYKSKTVNVKELFISYIIVTQGDQIAIRRRQQKGIWAGLYEFPVVESESKIGLDQIRTQFNLPQKSDFHLLHSITHKLTHRRLKINIYIVEKASKITLSPPYQLQKVKELHTFAFPKPLKNWIESHFMDQC